MSELPPSEVPPAEARDLADSVLAGRAYRDIDRPPSLQERFLNWIAELIGDLFGSLSSPGGRGFTAWIVIIVAIALILFLVSRLIRTRGALPKREPTAKPLVDILEGHTAAQWLAQAADAESAGDWRLGLRCRHRSLAATLVGRGLISDRPGLTAGEIYRSVAAARPHADDPMLEATNLFKDTWYGWADADEASRDRFVSMTEDVIRSVDRKSELVAG